MKRKGGLSLDLLRVSIGVFFALLGFYGILPNIEESVFTLTPGYRYLSLEVLFGIVELACGIIIIVSLFTFLPTRVKVVTSLLIFIFWCARVVIGRFVFRLPYLVTLGGFALWLLVLAAEFVIGVALWIFYRNSDL